MSRASPRIQREAVECQRQVFARLPAVLTLSEWARRSVIDDYGIDPDAGRGGGGGRQRRRPPPPPPRRHPPERSLRRGGLGAEGRPAAPRRLPPRCAAGCRPPAWSSWAAAHRSTASPASRSSACSTGGWRRRIAGCGAVRRVHLLRPALALRRLPQRHPRGRGQRSPRREHRRGQPPRGGRRRRDGSPRHRTHARGRGRRAAGRAGSPPAGGPDGAGRAAPSRGPVHVARRRPPRARGGDGVEHVDAPRRSRRPARGPRLRSRRSPTCPW